MSDAERLAAQVWMSDNWLYLLLGFFLFVSVCWNIRQAFESDASSSEHGPSIIKLLSEDDTPGKRLLRPEHWIKGSAYNQIKHLSKNVHINDDPWSPAFVWVTGSDITSSLTNREKLEIYKRAKKILGLLDHFQEADSKERVYKELHDEVHGQTSEGL